MTTSANKETIENRSRNQNLIAAMATAVISSGFLVLAGHLFGNLGFLIAVFVAMLLIEQIRTASNLSSLIRVGAAVGLLVGWLIYRLL
jgi:hypothetical protein